MRYHQFAQRHFVFGFLRRQGNIDLVTQGRLMLAADARIHHGVKFHAATWRVINEVLSCQDAAGADTMRFDQTLAIGGVPVTLGKRLTDGRELFLFEYVPLSHCYLRLLYVVASHYRYDVPRNSLLSQLIAGGIAPARIWVTLAESPSDHVQAVEGITFSHVTYNAYEYTALVDVLRRQVPFDLLFLIHDTCHAGPRFRTLVEKQPGLLPVDYLSVLDTGNYNIGWYRHTFLEHIRDFLETLVGVSKQRAIDIEMNRTGEGFKSTAPVTSNFLDSRGLFTGLHQPYSPDHVRNGRYLCGADIHKFYGMPPAEVRSTP
jgi:hypothetical protein